jgi:hypothetical protein
MGLPDRVPVFWADLIPAETRSRISDRSNSATEAKMCISSLLVGFDSSVSNP